MCIYKQIQRLCSFSWTFTSRLQVLVLHPRAWHCCFGYSLLVSHILYHPIEQRKRKTERKVPSPCCGSIGISGFALCPLRSSDPGPFPWLQEPGSSRCKLLPFWCCFNPSTADSCTRLNFQSAACSWSRLSFAQLLARWSLTLVVLNTCPVIWMINAALSSLPLSWGHQRGNLDSCADNSVARTLGHF